MWVTQEEVRVDSGGDKRTDCLQVTEPIPAKGQRTDEDTVFRYYRGGTPCGRSCLLLPYTDRRLSARPVGNWMCACGSDVQSAHKIKQNDPSF